MKIIPALTTALMLLAGVSAQPNDLENTYFTHVQQIYFENTSGHYDGYLIPSLKNYYVSFPQSAQEDQITFMLANIFQNERNDFSAFYYFSRLLFIYPSSKLSPQALAQTDSLLIHSSHMIFHEKSDSIRTLLAALKPDAEKRENLFAFFSFAYMLNIDSLQTELLQDMDRYRYVYGIDASYNDLLLLWKAKIYSQRKDYFTAYATLSELLALFPNAAVAPEAMLLCAKLNESALHNYALAKEYVLKIINDFPDKKESAEAQFLLGLIYEKDLGKPKAAIENYRLFVRDFPENHLRCQAFTRLARLLEQEKLYSEALQNYMEYYQNCADSASAINALQNILRISKENLNDRHRAAETLLLLASATESDSLRADYLYQAAESFAGLEDEQGRARQTCQLIIQQFPGSKRAELAKKLLRSLGKD